LKFQGDYLGKSVLKGLKYRSEVLLREFPDMFGGDFEKNKTALGTMELGLSKESRNVVAGYITRLAERQE
jgi:ribosomal protein S17E